MEIRYYGVDKDIKDVVNFDDSFEELIKFIARKADTLIRKGLESNLLLFRAELREYNLIILPYAYDKGIELKCNINHNDFSLLMDRNSVTFITTAVKGDNTPIYIVNEKELEEERNKLGKKIDSIPFKGFKRKLLDDKANLIFITSLRRFSNKFNTEKNIGLPTDEILRRGVK